MDKHTDNTSLFAKSNIIKQDIFINEINRSSEKTKKRYINASIFSFTAMIIAFLIFGMCSFLLPRQTYSEFEKRELEKTPTFSVKSLFNGTFTQELDSYFADHFAFRDNFVILASKLKEMRGFRFDDIKIHGNTTNPAVENEQSNIVVPENSAPIVQETLPLPVPEQDDPNEVGEKYGTVFVYKGKAMSVFGGSEQAGTNYASVLNEYQKALGDSIQIYNLLIPTAIEFYLPPKYKSVSNSQKESIDFIYSKLNPAIKTVDAYSTLQKHTDKYIYFNTDHHWTGLGAYYAYTAFAKIAGFEPASLSSFKTGRLDDFLGTLYGQTQDQKLKDYQDYVEYYKMPDKQNIVRFDKNKPFTPLPTTLLGEYAKGVNSYSVFLHGDHPLMRIDTQNKNGKKILMVKESYGNAFAPFLTQNYEQVYIVDQRYFQLGLVDFIKENGIQEVLFINNIFAANTGFHINKIKGLMYQKFYEQPPVPPVSEQSIAPPIIEEPLSIAPPISNSEPIFPPDYTVTIEPGYLPPQPVPPNPNSAPDFFS